MTHNYHPTNCRPDIPENPHRKKSMCGPYIQLPFLDHIVSP